MSPRYLSVYAFEAYWYFLRAADTLVDLILQRDVIESLTIIEEDEVGLACLNLFDAAAVQPIVSPGSFIDSAIMNPEYSSAIPLSFLMFTHVTI